MFNLKEKFEFLEDGIDFPFYNDIPKLSGGEWAILAIAVLVLLSLVSLNWIPKPYSYIVYCVVMLAPALYVCKGDYGLFFKKLKLRDFKTIILCTVGYIIYAAIIAVLLHSVGYSISGDSAVATTFDLTFIAGLFLQLIGEEFFKIFLLLIVMYLVYKFTQNRNLAIWVGIIVTLFVFGIAHMSAYGRLLQILLVQGLGTIFDLYAYMKTKNVFVSYIVHIIIDLYGYFGQLAVHA